MRCRGALILGVVLAISAPGPVQGQERTLYTATNANLRSAPSLAAEVMAVLLQGTAVTVAACDSIWCTVVGATPRLEGYISRSLLVEDRPTPRVSDRDVRRILMRRSIASYSGSCPCPYHRDRAGRSCGRRSAYSRPGGASPLCYESDVTRAMIRAYRARDGGSS